MTIYYHRLEYYDKPTKSYNRDTFKVEQLVPLAENDKYIVFNDPYFTKIAKGGDGFVHAVLNRPSITFKNVLSDRGVFYSVYSTSKKRIETIERQIREKAAAEYGYLFSEKLNLQILRLGAAPTDPLAGTPDGLVE